MLVTRRFRTRRPRLPLLVACGAWLLAWPVATAADLSGSASRAATKSRAPAPRPVKFDPAVVTAGGAGCCGADGRACGHVQHAGFHHAAGCRDGMCMPSCPVRPGQYGYYGTQWRRWPGQGVIQASATEAATPVPPPKSAVPGVQEESPARRGAEPPEEPQPPRASEPPVEEPAANPPANEGAAAEPEEFPAAPIPEPVPRDSASIESAGPWSRLIAAAHLPDGYEPPAAPLGDDQ
jgi:hypothetical protein